MPLIHGEHDPHLSCPPVVQVPVGLTADEARQILADHRPWVQIPTTTGLPAGTRLRVEFTQGVDDESIFVHPDDVPNPDADLIERMAQTIADNLACEGVGTVSPLYRELATKALAVVREAGAR